MFSSFVQRDVFCATGDRAFVPRVRQRGYCQNLQSIGSIDPIPILKTIYTRRTTRPTQNKHFISMWNNCTGRIHFFNTPKWSLPTNLKLRAVFIGSLFQSPSHCDRVFTIPDCAHLLLLFFWIISERIFEAHESSLHQPAASHRVRLGWDWLHSFAINETYHSPLQRCNCNTPAVTSS